MRTHLLILVVLLAGVRHAGAQRSCADALRRLPTDVEFVVVVDDPASLRSSDEGRGIVRALSALAQFEPFASSWSELAEGLGLSEREASDRLLGRRLVFAGRGLGGAEKPDGARWALMSEVSSETSKLLRSRLASSPRGVIDGYPVLALEDGRYELVSRPNGPEGSFLATGEDDGVTLILAATGQTEMVSTLLQAMRGRTTKTLEQTDVVNEARRVGACDAAIVGHLNGTMRNGIEAKPWEQYFVVSCLRVEDGMDIGLLIRDAKAEPRERVVEPWSDAPLHALSHDAAIAVLEGGGLPWKPDEDNPLRVVLSWLNIPKTITERLQGRQALVMRETAGGGIGLSLAFEAQQIASMAPETDRYMVRRMGELERELGGDNGQPAAVDVEGGVRTIRTEQDAPGLLSALLGRPPAVSWATVEAPDGSGWWVVSGVMGEAADSAKQTRTMCKGLVKSESKNDPKRWLSLGVVRPARVASLMERMLPRARREGMGGIERVTWALELTNLWDVEGRIEIRLADETP